MSWRQPWRSAWFRLQHLLHTIISDVRRLDGRKVFAFDDQFDLVGIEYFAFQQGCGHAVHRILIVRQNLHRGLVGDVDEHAHFFVNLLRGLLAEVAMLIDLASQEDLLVLLAESDWTEWAHAELANHAAGEIGSLFN